MVYFSDVVECRAIRTVLYTQSRWWSISFRFPVLFMYVVHSCSLITLVVDSQ